MVKPKDAPSSTGATALAQFSGDPDFMLSLARGLLVLRAFESEPQMTIGRAAALTGLPRPAARRCLYTLEQIGYLTGRDGTWTLRPVLLSLARAYLNSTRLAEAARPYLDALRDEVGESVSIGVLDADDVVYIARAETRRIISVSLLVGSHLPAYCTSMGRVLLAGLDGEQRATRLHDARLVARTPFTQTDPATLAKILDGVAHDGFAMVDQEMEHGLRSIAVPIRDQDDNVVAAMNVGVATHRIEPAELKTRILPALLQTAALLRERVVVS